MEPVILRLGQALSRHDAEAAAACYTEDAVYEEVATGLAVQGRAAIAAVTREVLAAFPDATFGLGRVIPGPGTATVEWWAEGTHLGPFRGLAPTGLRLRLDAASVLTFCGGLIARETAYCNAAALLRRALGALTASPEPVRRYLAALVAGDIPAATACFAPLGCREVVGCGVQRGRAAIARAWRRWAPFRLTDVGIPTGGGSLWSVRYALHLPGAPGPVPVLSVFTLSEAGIASERVYGSYL